MGSKPGPKARAFIGVGSNLGDRMSFLRSAVAGLQDVVRVSGVYETEPVGGPDGQGPYLNIVVELSTDLTPDELLQRGRALEEQAGRVRTVRFGPRTLDVDILLVGDESVATGDLVVPHPRMWERRFVVAPLAEIAPEVVAAHATETAGGEVERIVDWV